LENKHKPRIAVGIPSPAAVWKEGEIYMNLNKTIFNYSLASVLAFAFDKLYSLFGHGVTSSWMSNMFLYLLGLGVGVYTLLKVFVPDIVTSKNYRLFYNTYNSGVALLINGMLLMGILEVAGGSSQIAPWFLYIGSAFIAAGIVKFFMLLIGKKRVAVR
jgi:hypothetical protein